MTSTSRPRPPLPRTRDRRRAALGAALAAAAFGACNKGGDRASGSDSSMEEAGAYAGADKMAMDERMMAVDAAAPSSGTAGGLAMMPIRDHRKVVRTGHVSLVIKSYDETRARLDALVAAAGGFVDSTQVGHVEGQVSQATLVLRLPSSAFTELIPKLRELGQIHSETTDASDITAEYTDLASRLANARALERRLIDLAATRTGALSDVLEVERELARVRGEIEQYEGRIRMWDEQVSLSTLTISMSTEQPEIVAKPVAAPTFRDRIGDAFQSSVDTLGDAGEAAATFGVSLLPWMPLIIPGLLLGRRFVRRHLTLPRAIIHAPAPYYPPPPPPPPSDTPA